VFKSIKADKDSYITDKVVSNTRRTVSNTGNAGTLDVFKLYGASFSGSIPNTEKSRALLHFDLDPLRELVRDNQIDINKQSFWCKLKLHDVYGGQPTPANFVLSLFPLSASFDEGVGRDVSYYSDKDACNWISSSFGVNWIAPGASAGGFSTSSVDYITSSPNIPVTEVTQTFKTGTEDLLIDVTAIVSATLSKELPDSGFRLSFASQLEADQKTYFVKRFASRSAFDERKHPQLVFGFDDSIRDDTPNLSFNHAQRIVLYNYIGDSLENLTSGSNQAAVLGSNCLFLMLTATSSLGSYTQYFTGSQYSYDAPSTAFVSGTYYSDVTVLRSDQYIANSLSISGSVKLTPVWMSLDKTVPYATGSVLQFNLPSSTSARSTDRFTVSVNNVSEQYTQGDLAFARLNIFDQTTPYVKVVRLPVELPGIVVKNAYYQIRNSVTDEILIPFDEDKKSTLVSNDSKGMFFKFDTSCLPSGHSYTIDILIDRNGIKTRYPASSPNFRVV